MTTSPSAALFPRARAGLILALAALMALVTPGGVAQSAPHPELTVMTRNLYLGSSLAPAMDADPEDPVAFLTAVATIYGTAVFTDFPTRAGAIADEIAATEPDLIGLQEVTRWTAVAVAAPAAAPPSFDFLELLKGALADRGLDYSVAGVVDNANIGPVPLVAPPAGCVLLPPGGPLVTNCLVTLSDRDVILVNNDTQGLSVGPARTGRYAAQMRMPSPLGVLSFDRGWVAVDGRYMGKSFRFVNTHLETEDFPEVQEAQAAEFLRGPARGGQVIATGDFNSAADGTSTDTYTMLTAPPAFRDAWSVNAGDEGLTCCQNSSLTNPTSQLRSRIDLILTRGPIRAVSAEVVGDTPFRMPGAYPFWASDHAGVVATLRIR